MAAFRLLHAILRSTNAFGWVDQQRDPVQHNTAQHRIAELRGQVEQIMLFTGISSSSLQACAP
jgi:hypothetical protein